MPRTKIPDNVRRDVLTETGYRCAVPTCRNILAIDMHHIIEVKDGGPNEQSNLLALCPTCHALYTRGTISKEAINAWKTMLVALNHAFDQESISNLLFLYKVHIKISQALRKKMKTDEEEKEFQVDPISIINFIKFSFRSPFSVGIKEVDALLVTGDGVLKFSHLIASDLADFVVVSQGNFSPLYYITLTNKGTRIIEAWFSGNREAVKDAINTISQQ